MVIAVARIPARTIWRRSRVVLPPVQFVAAFVPFLRAVSGGRVVADDDCDAVLADPELLASHDLELPSGFDLVRVERRPHPGAVRV
jgi:hypothetical protein